MSGDQIEEEYLNKAYCVNCLVGYKDHDLSKIDCTETEDENFAIELLDYKDVVAELQESKDRLKKIAQIIWDVDSRCLAYDGDVGKTREEITDKEMKDIYLLTNPKKP